MSQSHGDLGGKELRLVFREPLDVHQVAEEFSTLHEVHQEVYAELVLEDKLHVYKEGVFNAVENVLFQLDVLHLLVFNHDVLADALHREHFASVSVLNQEHLSERAFPN